ncbi:alpha-galactosidase [Streptacidiphilus pinicola]|uniref:alpha-galactosidase n=1 Tax=Streptacidiphilus pinicola TaxID=2219663 RepID=UPI001FB533E6|nr:alpha-galactosidase [Streptacidiphilus pinicola]
MPQATALTANPQVSEIDWGLEALPLRFRIDGEGAVRIVRAGPVGAASHTEGPGLPLVEIQLSGSGRKWSGERSVETSAGARLLYRGHEADGDGTRPSLRIDLADPVTGLVVEAHYRAVPGVPVVRAWTTLRNEGAADLTVEAVTSLVLPGFGRSTGRERLARIDVHWAASDWLAEGRWQSRPLRELLPDLSRFAHEHGPRGCFARSSQGSWSSGRYLPTGALVHGGGHAWAWQIESSGGWRWEVGEHDADVYLALLGPHDREHQWRQVLRPGEEFTTVRAAVAVGVTAHGDDALTAALAALTRYRRAVRRPHRDHTVLPVIFNDYMNTLMGDPTTERLLPLVDAASRAGAEYFVIDAGWYDDDAEGWWDSVGEWRESAARFPGGLGEVCQAILAAGMTPGLWLEPEVVGVRSRVAEQLPSDAFFQRDGERVVEHGRYHLDLRHPAARAHLDAVVDRLVADYAVGYFKLDYNINPGPGTDTGTSRSPGAGLLGHQRAYTDWLSDVLDRHPGLTIENCASGGMRADYALLAQAQLQSTSDQQDPLRYPPIAASAPAAIAPEQAAVWAYPQPGSTDEEIAFTVAGALLGRVHLSGHLDRMTPHQHALVAEGIAVYKRLRADIPASTPLWPLGLPGWEDHWLCLGLRGADRTYLLVWRRGGAGEQVLPVPHLAGSRTSPRVLYPTHRPTGLGWNADQGSLRLSLAEETPGACLLVFERDS